MDYFTYKKVSIQDLLFIRIAFPECGLCNFYFTAYLAEYGHEHVVVYQVLAIPYYRPMH